VQRPEKVQTLRIMHCPAFHSLKGIQAFTSVKQLNLSSNAIISMEFLVSLTKVEDLNLSCNKINVISNLKGMAGTLKKLVLSHNRIGKLDHFREVGFPEL